jgi:hypothetical protein
MSESAKKPVPPRGSEYIYNRLDHPFEKLFDGAVYEFDAHEQRLMPYDLAQFMYRTSVISFEPVTGQAVRALVTTEDPEYGVPYDKPLGLELMDRSVSDNYTQRGTDGVPTKVKILPVPGGGFDQGRRIEKAAR